MIDTMRDVDRVPVDPKLGAIPRSELGQKALAHIRKVRQQREAQGAQTAAQEITTIKLGEMHK